MKAHSDSLSPTLDALSSSFESIAKLSDQLSNVLQPALSPPPQRLQSQSPIDVSRDLIPIATLPRRLRDVIALGRDGSGGADRSTLSKEDAGMLAGATPERSPIAVADRSLTYVANICYSTFQVCPLQRHFGAAMKRYCRRGYRPISREQRISLPSAGQY